MLGIADKKIVFISGAGMLGLTATAMVKSRGARDVIIADISNERLEMAKQFGATSTVNISRNSEELRAAVHERTEGRGVDLSFEFCGVNPSVENCIETLRIGGKCILVGSTFPSPSLPVSIESIVRGIKQIQGLHNYTPGDLATALVFLDRYGSQYPFGNLVAKTFSLEDAHSAFQYSMDHNVFRVAVTP